MNAIFPAEDVPEAWLAHIELNARWYADKAAARTAVDVLKPR